jgi:hypothetical protein
VSHGVRVQLNNGSSKRECLGASGATTSEVYHYSYTLNVPVFRDRMHVCTSEELNIHFSPKKYDSYKFFKTFVSNEAN